MHSYVLLDSATNKKNKKTKTTKTKNKKKNKKTKKQKLKLNKRRKRVHSVCWEKTKAKSYLFFFSLLIVLSFC